MPLDDHELLAEWSRSRYERAFRTLVDRRLPLVFGTATRIARQPEQADELAMRAFVRLASQPPRLTAGQSLSGWLHATTLTLAGEGAGGNAPAAPAGAPPTEPHAANHEPPADWSQMAPVIDELIAALPAADREPLMWRFIEGLSYGEVGQRLGMAEPAARQRCGRALEKLRHLLGGREVITSAAALATLLPAHAALAAPAGLTCAIVNAAIATPFAAVSSDNKALLLRRTAVAAALVLLVAAAVRQQALIAELKQAAAAAHGADGARTTSSHSAAAREVSATAPAGLAARALTLARMSDPLARDAALAEWSARFTGTGDILQVAAALRAEPAGTAALRAAIASHLVRQWAAVDAAGCLTALLRDGALYRRDPFDSDNNVLAIGDDAAMHRVGLCRLLAGTHPAALDAWLKTSPPDLIPALLGDRKAATFAAWAIGEGLDDAALDQLDRRQDGGPPPGEAFLAGDFAEVLVARAPELLLRPALEGYDLAGNEPYLGAIVARFGADEAFAAGLLKRFSPASLWELFERFPAGDQAPEAEGFARLARLELAARPRAPHQAAAAAIAQPPGIRQAATLTALLESLQPETAGYRAGLDAVARAVDATSAAADGLGGLREAGLYAHLRTRLAAGMAREDPNAALAWAAAMRHEGSRTSCLAAIAAQDLRPDVRAWAAAAADDASVMVVRCETLAKGAAAPMVLSEFELPPMAGETVAQTYVRIRSILDDDLRTAGLQTKASAVAPLPPAPAPVEPPPVPIQPEPLPEPPAPEPEETMPGDGDAGFVEP